MGAITVGTSFTPIQPVDGRELVINIPLTHAQILTLDTTDVDILIVPNSGEILIPKYVFFTASVQTAYTNLAATATIQVEYQGITFKWLTVLDNNVNTQLVGFLAVGSHYAIAIPFANGTAAQSVGDLTLIKDTSKLVISMTNAAAGNLTGGIAGNKMNAFVYFQVLNLNDAR